VVGCCRPSAGPQAFLRQLQDTIGIRTTRISRQANPEIQLERGIGLQVPGIKTVQHGLPRTARLLLVGLGHDQQKTADVVPKHDVILVCRLHGTL